MKCLIWMQFSMVGNGMIQVCITNFDHIVIYCVETTRVCPFPFPIWKNCTESIDLTDFDGRTVHIDKGVKIILPINALHSHPDFYVNPDSFEPDRFDDNKGGVKRLKDAGVFMPFGNGKKICKMLSNFFFFFFIKNNFVDAFQVHDNVQVISSIILLTSNYYYSNHTFAF